VGYEALKRANPGVDPWLPGEGTRVVIPTQFVIPHAPQRGIVVNIAELRLYYFPDDAAGAADSHGNRRIVTYPISIGQLDWSTPLGTTKVTGKVLNPSWYPPQSIRAEHAERDDVLPRVVPPGPDNPLGQFRLRLSYDSYGIHGTDTPWAIGRETTHGCIRLYPEDIGELYSLVKPSMRGELVYEPVKVGESDGHIYVEAHDDVYHHYRSLDNEAQRVVRAAGVADRVDPVLVREAVRERRGVPVDVTRGSGLLTKASR